MSAIKLSVSNLTDSEDQQEYIFNQDHITIGRAGENDLSLPDPKRIVSGEHAEIRCEHDTYQLIDRGSKNFTYLNSERVVSGEPHTLQEGDTFRIGDFELHVGIFDREAGDDDRTVFDPRFSNPFDEQVEELAELLDQIRATFDHEALNRRKDALRTALHDALITDDERHEADAMIGRMLRTAEQSADEDGNADMDTGRPVRGNRKSETSAKSSRPVHSSTRETDGRIERLMGVLFEGFTRMIHMPGKFRHEFIGQTIVQSPDEGFLYAGDAATLQNQLLDTSVSEEKFSRRLDLLEDALDDLMRHQVAMIEGYKASARTGSEKLLDVLDPKKVEAELSKEHKLYDLLPLLARFQIVRHLQHRCDELREDDWSVAERRVFRPTFIKAYLARMTSRNHEESPSDRHWSPSNRDTDI